jgi:hypothetical protein
MTLKELSQLYYLNREIEMDQQRLEELRARAASPAAPKLDGMPHNPSVDNRLERYIAEIVDMEVIISAKQTQCIRERNRLLRYIADVPDSLTRQILTLRCVNGLNWLQVAAHIGGGNTEVGVKQRFYRYVRGQNGSD